ncbi:hypothetical protein [Flavobacterium sp.]|jgi:hypothetical protein|uniref:hypothetical protein n=1 Tax=Flavobacterium sp. TaxID=239 RepID=UPI0037BF05F5
MKEEKKIDFVFDISKHLQSEIKNSKYIKYVSIATTVVGVILAIGFASKAFNYTIGNLKTLSQTLKKQ